MFIASSSFNAHIRVNEEWGKMKLLVNGSPQSGAYIEGLWKKAFKHFSILDFGRMPYARNPDVRPKRALILGIGGGTVITLLSKYFPGILLTCVDIDPVMIHIAQTYFSLGDIPHTTIVCADASDYIASSVCKKSTYDMVIVDLFLGRVIPDCIEHEQFLKNIKHILGKQGVVYINYLRELEYKNKSDMLAQTLASIFPRVRCFCVARNCFFECK